MGVMPKTKLFKNKMKRAYWNILKIHNGENRKEATMITLCKASQSCFNRAIVASGSRKKGDIQ